MASEIFLGYVLFRERERERDTDRQTDTEREDAPVYIELLLYLFVFLYIIANSHAALVFVAFRLFNCTVPCCLHL